MSQVNENQVPHEDPDFWPVPMGRGLLVEVDYKENESSIIQLSKELHNVNSAVVRAVSPNLPEGLEEKYLPSGQMGDFGERVLVMDAQLDYLEESTYQECGFETPNPETNGKGDLALVDVSRVQAILTPSEELPFTPLGKFVYFEYDFDEESTDAVDSQTKDKVEEEDDAEGILMLEKTVASEHQVATVTGVGPACNKVGVGDRVLAPRHADSVTYDGEQYACVTDEDKLRALISKAQNQDQTEVDWEVSTINPDYQLKVDGDTSVDSNDKPDQS